MLKNIDLLTEKYEDLSPAEIIKRGTIDPKFDDKKGLEVLAKKDKTGTFIYDAGVKWRDFPFDKGYEYLEKIRDEALKNNKDGRLDSEKEHFYIKAENKWKEKPKNSRQRTGKKVDLTKLTPELIISEFGEKNKRYDFDETIKILYDKVKGKEIGAMSLINFMAKNLYILDKKQKRKIVELVKKMTNEKSHYVSIAEKTARKR
jgi:hypothetical protein